MPCESVLVKKMPGCTSGVREPDGRRGTATAQTGCRAPRPGALLRPPRCPEAAPLSVFNRRAGAAAPEPRES